MTTGVIASPPILQFTLNNGQLAVNGSILTQVGGVNAATYSDIGLTASLPNPIPLNSRGEISDASGNSKQLFLTPNTVYTFTLFDGPNGTGNQIWQATYVNGVQINLTQAILGPLLWPQTAAEAAAGVTPVNYFYAPYPYIDPRRYGAVGDGVTNDTSAVQAALNVAAKAKEATVFIPPSCSFLCTSDLLVPTGQGQAVDVLGGGWTNPGIIFSGAGVTHGLYFNGAIFGDYAGSVRNLNIKAQNSASGGITYNSCNHPRIERCLVQSVAGRGIYILDCLMSEIVQTLLTGCGSATTGSVEVDTTGPGSTTFMWLHSRISTGNTTVGGLLIDRTSNILIYGGNIESAGMLLRIGSKTESSKGCGSFIVQNIDLENPGNGNSYIDLGSGLSGSARIQCGIVQGCAGFPSGTTTVPYAVVMNQCNGVDFIENQWSQSGATSTHELVGASNLGVHIYPHRASFGNTWPWARVNSVMVNAAGPHLDWFSDSVPNGLVNFTSSITGATPSILILASQGGYYGKISVHNTGATTMTSLTGGQAGMALTLRATDASTTIQHSAFGTANGLHLLGGANLLLTNGQMYNFVHDGTMWVQV